MKVIFRVNSPGYFLFIRMDFSFTAGKQRQCHDRSVIRLRHRPGRKALHSHQFEKADAISLCLSRFGRLVEQSDPEIILPNVSEDIAQDSEKECGGDDERKAERTDGDGIEPRIAAAARLGDDIPGAFNRNQQLY